MLRFPNPGSTIHHFVLVYTSAFDRLHDKVASLDDLTDAIVDANLATSSGYMGLQATRRSRRPDRSRDPLYNQLKMYAELFRSMGWLHPTEQSSLHYTFTLLGRQLVAAESNYLPLLGESLLGLVYPNRILSIRNCPSVRPFSLILQTMLACEGMLSRDEMIVGPLSTFSDREGNSLPEVAEIVTGLRKSQAAIDVGLSRTSERHEVQINTLRNYTRWPIAAMRDSGWTTKAVGKFTDTGDSFKAHKLTSRGEAIAKRLTSSLDIRLDQVESLPLDGKRALSIHGYYSMLAHAGFDVEPVHADLEQLRPQLAKVLRDLGSDPNRPFIFSPFQTLSIKDIAKIFPSPDSELGDGPASVLTLNQVVGRDSSDHLLVHSKLNRKVPRADDDGVAALKHKLQSLSQKHVLLAGAVDALVASLRSSRQDEFYPFIVQVFRILGFECERSRAGVNYQRWDAFIRIGGDAIPIEIKSPTEEEFLSTKAVRQAVENKVVLLARGGMKTTRDSSSLIVGYRLPNERAEMASLIDDIHSAFGIRIGVIDLYTLAFLAFSVTMRGLVIDEEQVRTLRGFLCV